MAHDSIGSENNELVVAGGMESMTNAPHILPKSRDGLSWVMEVCWIICFVTD